VAFFPSGFLSYGLLSVAFCPVAFCTVAFCRGPVASISAIDVECRPSYVRGRGSCACATMSVD